MTSKPDPNNQAEEIIFSLKIKKVSHPVLFIKLNMYSSKKT